MTDASLRRSRLVSAATLSLWAVSALSLVGYAIVLGRSGVRRQLPARLSPSGLESGVEPLLTLLGTTVALAVLTVLSVLYYNYVQWRRVKRCRRRLESDSELEAERT